MCSYAVPRWALWRTLSHAPLNSSRRPKCVCNATQTTAVTTHIHAHTHTHTHTHLHSLTHLFTNKANEINVPLFHYKDIYLINIFWKIKRKKMMHNIFEFFYLCKCCWIVFISCLNWRRLGNVQTMEQKKDDILMFMLNVYLTLPTQSIFVDSAEGMSTIDVAW